MRPIQAPCPTCAAPVEFKVRSAMVTVCEYCRTVVGRGDRSVADYGKVAEIVETASPLQLGLRGKYRGKPFELVGRVQFQHEAGGVWDEWYAAFRNRKWGWLSEAQGRFYLTFEKKLSKKSALPALKDLEVGRRFQFPRVGDLTVKEIGSTTPISGEGEMPFALVPGVAHDYADLEGADGVFATFDYSEAEPSVFLGKEITLEQLGISKDALGPDRGVRQVAAKQVSCPKCAGALNLLAPDQTLRVCCPSCGSLLDCDHGNLKYLTTLKIGKLHPLIPLGSVGTLRDVEYTLIGYLRRSVTYEGRDYFWSEYLLYDPHTGFRWLINSNAHWSFGEPVSAGDVRESIDSVEFRNQSFAVFERATATVRHVLGEFPWKVMVGEQTKNRDFIRPPHMVSIEQSMAASTATAVAFNSFLSKFDTYGELTEKEESPVVEAESESSNRGEVNYTLATYIPHQEIETAFDVEELPRAFKPGPLQPNPVDGRIGWHWLGFVAVLGVLDIVISLFRSQGVDQWVFAWALAIVSIMPLGAAIYSHNFERERWRDSDFSPYTYNDEEDDD